MGQRWNSRQATCRAQLVALAHGAFRATGLRDLYVDFPEERGVGRESAGREKKEDLAKLRYLQE